MISPQKDVHRKSKNSFGGKNAKQQTVGTLLNQFIHEHHLINEGKCLHIVHFATIMVSDITLRSSLYWLRHDLLQVFDFTVASCQSWIDEIHDDREKQSFVSYHTPLLV